MNWIKIWELIKNPTVQRLMLSVALILCIFLWTKSCNNQKDQLDQANNNFDAYKGKTETIILKNGQLERERLLFITEKDQLGKYSDSLKKELDKEKEGVKIIWRERIVLKDTTIYVDSSKYVRLNDTTYGIYWAFNNTSPSLFVGITGNSLFTIDSNRNIKNLVSHLLETSVCIDVVTGIREVAKNRYVTFVRTREANSKVTFEEIEGAIVDPSLFNVNEDYIIFGPYFGFGFQDNTAKEFINKFGFSIGIAVTFKLWGTHF